jgi:aquaporin NIP
VIRKLLAEFLGTFILVFVGCGCVVTNSFAPDALGLHGIAVVWGLTVAVLIYAFGDISGTHINPAVTTALAVSRRFSWSEYPGYVGAQFAGATVAAVALQAFFPQFGKELNTFPTIGVGPTFVMEIFLTFFLMLTALCVSNGPAQKGITAGLVLGAVVCAEVLFAGPLTGASMNPARTIGPALVTGHLDTGWIYLVATTLGALLALPVYSVLNPYTDATAATETGAGLP